MAEFMENDDAPLTKLEILALRLIDACQNKGCNLTEEQFDAIMGVLGKEFPFYK